MTKEEMLFLEENSFIFDTIRVGYAKNLNQDLLEKYEQVYRNNIDANFVLTNWCGNCVYDMLNRIMMKYDKQKQDEINIESNEVTTTKRGRPAKA